MKRVIYLLAVTSILISCSDNKSTEHSTNELNNDTSTIAVALNDTAISTDNISKNEYAYPIKYKDWEIGNPTYIKTVLELYKAWDNKKAGNVSQYFGDTVRLRIPEERQEIILPNAKIDQALHANRGMYDSTSNNIISAISLHDRERNEDWVMVNTYNKWIETNGKRDSVLYHDEFRIKNNKIDFMWSFSKLPTATFLKRNDPKK